jgi:predicted transcriptional regulator
MTECPKKSAQEIIGRLLDDADWGQVMYALYVAQKIERSLAEVAAGRMVSHDEVRRELLSQHLTHRRPRHL